MSSMTVIRLNKDDLLIEQQLRSRLAWATITLTELGVGYGLIKGENSRDIG